MVDRLRPADGASLDGWEEPAIPEGFTPEMQEEYRRVFAKAVESGIVREVNLPLDVREEIERTGKVLSLTSTSGKIYPAFQFNGEGRVREDVDFTIDVVGMERMVGLIDWWISPNPELQGMAPKFSLADADRHDAYERAMQDLAANYTRLIPHAT